MRTLLSDKNLDKDLENKQAREAYYRLLDCVRDLSYVYDFSDADIRHVSGLFTNLFVQFKVQEGKGRQKLNPRYLDRVDQEVE